MIMKTKHSKTYGIQKEFVYSKNSSKRDIYNNTIIPMETSGEENSNPLFSFLISWSLITLQYCSGFCHTLT